MPEMALLESGLKWKLPTKVRYKVLNYDLCYPLCKSKKTNS